MRAMKGAIFALCSAFILAGCGGSQNAEVSGTVTFDGKPIENGSIVFLSADGNGPTTGGTIENGKYSVQNVPVGLCKIQIKAAKETTKMKMYDDPKAEWVQKAGEEMLPPKYTDEKATELNFEVKSGKNEKDFSLTK